MFLLTLLLAVPVSYLLLRLLLHSIDREIQNLWNDEAPHARLSMGNRPMQETRSANPSACGARGATISSPLHSRRRLYSLAWPDWAERV